VSRCGDVTGKDGAAGWNVTRCPVHVIADLAKPGFLTSQLAGSA
jgi:hypothetical protein